MTGPLTRRTLIRNGCLIAALFTATGAAGAELVSRGVLPGRTVLEKLDGACSAPAPAVPHGPPGPSLSGTFRSAARRRPVGYTIAYPPGRRPGDELPLVIMLHGYGANHANALAGLSPAQALALRPGGRPLAPVAMVAVDGGNGYWNPHPGDDPMAISPAIWTSYPQARAASPGAYASAAGLRRRRRGHARHGAARSPGAGRVRLRRPVPPRGPGAGPRVARGCRGGVRPGVPRRFVLRRAAAAVARLPGRSPVLARRGPVPPSGLHRWHTPLPRSRPMKET